MSSFAGINFQGFTAGYLIASFIVSTIGFSYFLYGKKTLHTVAMVSGVILLVFPYFVQDIRYMIGIAVVLCLLPFVLTV